MKILGLDLGVGSVGWALIETDENHISQTLLGLGSRIINLSVEETKTFNNGKGITLNANRTMLRTMRKGLHRYKMRRSLLRSLLVKYGLYDPKINLTTLPPLALWKLRSDAATPGSQVSLPELGRVLSHLSKKRGYKHSKSDEGDSSTSEYVKQVNGRFAEIKTADSTVGQYFYKKLLESEIKDDNGKSVVNYRVKEQVFPRKAYEEEFFTIMENQRYFYPEILTDNTVKEIWHAIFYQRPLKSCKHLVSICEFEKRPFIIAKNGKSIEIGPKVAPRTSPISQLTRIYEVVNNIRIVNPHNKKRLKVDSQPSLFDELENNREYKLLQHEYVLSGEERMRIVEYLNTHEKLTSKDLLNILGLKKSDGFRLDKNVGKGIKGNDTYIKLWNALEGVPEREKLLQFHVKLKDVLKKNTETGKMEPAIDPETGEVLQEVDPAIINQPLYQLWHTLYSITDKDELIKVLENKFDLGDDVAQRLYTIDFRKDGFANRCAKFMRRILPFLMQGYMYSEACTMVGINHSNSLTKEENEERILKEKLSPIPKNSLRQPIVEKILNQMVNVVNAIVEKYGQIDEVRVELARPLKMTADQRATTTENINKRERENKKIAEEFEKYNLPPTRRRIQKYRMWKEVGCKCMYCGKSVKMADFMNDMENEIEHIIPRSRFFDDSFSNKTFACRKCNKEKGNSTAYDYMSSKSEEELSAYIERVEELYAKKIISRTKRDRFLTSGNDIPEDFLERDLRQTQYITKKACEILRESIRNVWVTSGSVTDFLRHVWGYDTILHDLNLDRYASADLVEEIVYEHAGHTHKRLQIKEWSKRLDHRHHAIDALTAALTRQSYIQRLNKMNAEHGSIYEEVIKAGYTHRTPTSLLNKWGESRPHIEVNKVAAALNQIAVSAAGNNKFVSPGRRNIKQRGKLQTVQTGIIVPRGPLHEESIYGKNLVLAGKKNLKEAFLNPSLIVDKHIKEQIENRIKENGDDPRKALKTLKKDPISIIDPKKGEKRSILEVECFEEKFVIKYKLSSIEFKNIDNIVDKAVRELVRKRYEECEKDQKTFQRSLTDNPLKMGNGVIRSVRCFTKLSPEVVIELRKDSNENPIGYAKSGSNHHVAFYRNPKGEVVENVTSFWDAIQRKRHGISVIIKNPKAAIDQLISISDDISKETLLIKMPSPDWEFVEILKKGDTFILGLSDEEIEDAISSGDNAKLLQNLYKVQKFSTNQYFFRLHIHTNLDTSSKSALDRKMKNFLQFSCSSFWKSNPHRVHISKLGEISYD